MIRLLFVLKPIWYVVAYVIAHRRFAAYGPHTKLPPWLAVGLAGLLRVGLGVAGFFMLQQLPEAASVFWGGFVVLGFAWWLLLAKAFFSRTPTRELVMFALVCEALSAALDVALMVDMKDFRLC